MIVKYSLQKNLSVTEELLSEMVRTLVMLTQINTLYTMHYVKKGKNSDFQYIWSVFTIYSKYINIVRYSLHNCAEKLSSIHDYRYNITTNV